jgi:RHS repeat-associated protein
LCSRPLGGWKGGAVRPNRSRRGARLLRRRICFRKRRLFQTSSQGPVSGPVLGPPRTCLEGPFGEVIRATGPTAKANPFRFSTKYQDDETDLLYYGHRYYNVSTGRWISRDPMAEGAGNNLYGLVDNDPLSNTDTLGYWNSRVHLWMTMVWSREASFQPAYGTIIGISDNDVDNHWGTSPFPWGEMERHLNQPSKTGGQDSRDVWYQREYANAVNALVAGDEQQDGMRCIEAAQAFGRGLHSWQDRSAHRVWPRPGRDWRSTIAHPAWWDDWYGEVDAGIHFSDLWWADYYSRHPGNDDYNGWTWSATQFLSQDLARERVTTESQEEIGRFVEEVRHHCFCRNIMLLRQ